MAERTRSASKGKGYRALAVRASLLVMLFAAPIHAELYDINAFIHTLDSPQTGVLTIGYETATTPVVPPTAPIGPVAPQVGPITTGIVTGQFDFVCATPGGCTNVTDFSSEPTWNWKWAVARIGDLTTIEITDFSWLANDNGETLFGSSYSDGGFFGPIVQFDAVRRFVPFHFNIEDSESTGAGSGISLDPGYGYIFVAFQAEQDLSFTTQVPTFPWDMEFGSYIAWDMAVNQPPPHQYHSQKNDVFFDGWVHPRQIVTGGFIPVVVPEPGTALMMVLGGLVLTRRRTTRPGKGQDR